MSHYTHFTTEERELSRELKALGYSICQIAARLGRNKSSVSREFKRNSNKDGSYSAHAADDRYKQRRKRCGRKPMLRTQTRTGVIQPTQPMTDTNSVVNDVAESQCCNLTVL